MLILRPEAGMAWDTPAFDVRTHQGTRPPGELPLRLVGSVVGTR